MDSLDTIQGFDISFSDYSKRIINIKIEDEIIDKLIFPFKNLILQLLNTNLLLDLHLQNL